MTTFARLSRPLIQELQKLPPCARQLHEYLLENHPAGRPQEVELETFAELCDCGIKYLRSCLKRLIESNLVEVVRRYSASVYKLVAHDDRTLNFATGKKSVQEDNGSVQKGNIRVQKEASNPYFVVTNNKEEFKANKDTHPLHPVNGNERESGLVASESLAGKAVSEPTELSIQEELRTTLQQPLNKNILAVLQQYPETRARDALDALREAIAKGSVKNPAGWFVQAIRKGYKPNHTRSSQSANTASESPKPQVPEDFSAWYALAFRAGVVSGSGHNDNGELMVYGPDQAEPYEQARQTYPLETLLRRWVETPAKVSAPNSPSTPVQPVPVPENIHNERARQNALARLKAKFDLPLLRKEAIAEALIWEFSVSDAGIAETAF